MYKDKDKQRESGAERQRRYRENRKALHPAIVAGINRLTANADGSINEQERSRRMANALHYERACPGRPYTGVGIELSKGITSVSKCSTVIPDGSTNISVVKALHQAIRSQSYNPGYVSLKEGGGS